MQPHLRKEPIMAGTIKELTRKVTLVGLQKVIFDRYAGDNSTALEVGDKLYLDPKDGSTVVLPALNLTSFLSAQNTPSAPKRFLDKRKYKAVAAAALSFVTIEPELIPFTRNGKPVQFYGFDENGVDKKGGFHIVRHVARLKDGIPNPKVRPALDMPWELSFTIRMFPNDDLNEPTLRMLFEKGGIAIGIGTFRGVYGKFKVEVWE
jgi:hypothetical protein